MTMKPTVSAVSEVLETLEKRDRREEYKYNPVLWAEDIAGVHLWSKQAEIAMSVARNKNVAVKAGHGVGKSFLAGLLIVWWVWTRYPNMMVASTAPSRFQINAVVWKEVRILYSRINQRAADGIIETGLPGYITSDAEWKDDRGIIFGVGRKPPDQKTDDAFQGLHASEGGGVLGIGDEAVGLTEEMIDALGNITTNSESRRFLICNPTNPASYVGQLFKNKPSNWTFHTISVLDNPNFTDEEVPENVRGSLSDETFLDSKREEYGEGTPRWISRIEGEFAFDVENSLITDQEIGKAYDTNLQPEIDSRPILGVDVARFGQDKSAIYINDGGNLRLHSSWEKAPGTETANRIHRAALETGASQVRIDGAGLGGPIVDMVVSLNQHNEYVVLEMKGSAASPDKRKWYNIRAWWYDGFRAMLAAGKIDLDPEDAKLVDELLSIQYKFSPSGALLIESKDDMRKRGIHSPDYADAAVYAMADMDFWLNGPEKVGDKVYLRDEESNKGLWDSLGW